VGFEDGEGGGGGETAFGGGAGAFSLVGLRGSNWRRICWREASR
jgi:hypothetical protein